MRTAANCRIARTRLSRFGLLLYRAFDVVVLFLVRDLGCHDKIDCPFAFVLRLLFSDFAHMCLACVPLFMRCGAHSSDATHVTEVPPLLTKRKRLKTN